MWLYAGEEAVCVAQVTIFGGEEPLEYVTLLAVLSVWLEEAGGPAFLLLTGTFSLCHVLGSRSPAVSPCLSLPLEEKRRRWLEVCEVWCEGVRGVW